MSINVNVSGNPVSIKRGKLITADLDYGSDELQKRRRIRLEQVRQQSKNIAEQVRNKVRNEKSKQFSDIEKRGQKELKKWQTQKLLSLQQQYQECLKDIGLGHAQAVLEEESDVEYERQNDNYKHIAKVRGTEAAQKLNDLKQKRESEGMVSLQKKKLNRDIENTRSKMVASIPKNIKSPFKKKKRPKLTTDINISRRITKTTDDNDSETADLTLLNMSSASSDSGKSERNEISKSNTATSVPFEEKCSSSEVEDKSEVPVLVKQNPSSTKHITDSRPTVPILTQKDSKLREELPKNLDHYLSTQISDRIKSRHIVKNFEPSNSNVCDVDVTGCRCCCRLQPNPTIPAINEEKATKNDNNSETNTKRCEREDVIPKIPCMPTVALRTAPSSTATSNLNKVQYCDYKNHYTKEYIPTQSTIERISKENVEVGSSPRSEVEYIERMYKHDQDAQIRGKKALEKEKVCRDYKEMMQQLPVLQKQERVASISSNKPLFHMSNNRLKEHQKKNQTRMENAYEKLFPKPRIITIPPKDLPKDNSTLPFQTISVNGTNPPVLDVGSWDFDMKFNARPHIDSKHPASDLIQESLNKVLGDSDNQEELVSKRRELLQEMWKSIKDKREKLVKEINELPESSKLRTFLTEIGDVDQYLKMENKIQVDKMTETTKSKEKMKTKSGKVSSSSPSPGNTNSPAKGKSNRGVANSRDERFSRYHCLCTLDSSSSPVDSLKRPKVIHRTRYKKLQNTSTQTTPRTEPVIASKPDEVRTTASVASVEDNKNVAEKITKPSDSVVEVDNDQQHSLCQIIIKIDDEGKPQVCVGPSKLKEKEIIIKTGIRQNKSETGKQYKCSKDVSELGKTVQNPSEEIKSKQKSKNKPSQTKKVGPEIHKSWRDYLSQNSTNTSTSYYSPPDPTANVTKAPHGAQPHHLAGILRDKPQQRNIQSNSSATSSNALNSKECVLKCIKKLLTMSRQSIEDLQVSSVSEITTPGSSIIQTNLNAKLSENNKDLSPALNGTDSSTLSARSLNNEQGSTNEMTLDEYATTNYPEVMAIYNKLAENCTKKIEFLSSLLEKNRLERLILISPSTGSSSDNDASTKYMTLPPECSKRTTEVIDNKKVDDKSSSSTDEQEILNQHLLNIDYTLVERLKNMTPAQISEQFPENNLSISESSSNDNDNSLNRRFREIVESHSAVPKDKSSEANQFPLLLIDPQDLPTLQVKHLCSKAKPPPSRGLTVARRFNNNITNIPHQLSTIIESDTVFSTKAQKTQTSESSLLITSHESQVLILQGPASTAKTSHDQSLAKAPASVFSTSTTKTSSSLPETERRGPAKTHESGTGSSPTKTSSSDSLPDIITELVNDIKQNSSKRRNDTSDSSTSDYENLETMLESLGLGSWALATLRKTQEALAIPSTSTSTNNGSQHKETSSSSQPTEALENELGSSKFCESNDSSLFVRELQNISAFDKATRRTSTPIETSVSDNSENSVRREMEMSSRTSSDKSSRRGMS